jgi:predicted DNA-binding transcriptional regulator AlpA
MHMIADTQIDRFFGLGLSREIAARFIGVSATTFDVMVKDGRMPVARRIGARKLWSRVELESAFDALPKDEDAGINPWDQDAAA